MKCNFQACLERNMNVLINQSWLMTSARMPNRAFCSTRKLSNCLLSYPIISGYFGCFLGISFDILFFYTTWYETYKNTHTHISKFSDFGKGETGTEPNISLLSENPEMYLLIKLSYPVRSGYFDRFRGYSGMFWLWEGTDCTFAGLASLNVPAALRKKSALDGLELTNSGSVPRLAWCSRTHT